MDQKQKLLLKYQALQRENALLDKQIQDFKAKGVTTDLRPQMQALHDYNEMKDLTQIVLGHLTNSLEVTISDLHDRYNLPLD